MAKRLAPDEKRGLLRQLVAVQEAFPYTEEGFLAFSNYCLNKLVKGGPDLTRTQADLARYLFLNGTKRKKVKLKKLKGKRGTKGKAAKHYEIAPSKKVEGNRLRMVQANRGLGKTTLCAIYAVFRIIHDTTTRVLIFSAGGKLSREIANWVIQIIEGLDILQFMMPDVQNGDRASVESYDIHWALRGSEKAPSVKCLGVDSNAAGSRADLLIADDIESMKNSRTVMMRELLVELTKEFESICQKGDIVYLGTPQFFESIYNGLPSRGFDVRIWTGRYPNVEQLPTYQGLLAPMLEQDIANDPELQTGHGIDGMQGAPTCPEMFDDELLIEKEISQGKSKFQLQYMLNTRMADSERYPLKINNLIVCSFTDTEGPVSPVWTNDDRDRVNIQLYSNQAADALYSAMPVKGGYELRPFERSLMYIDPAGGGKNGDETGYAVIRLLGSYVYLQAWGGVKGGYEDKELMELVEVAKKHKVKEVFYEKNYGNGAIAALLQPYFEKYWPVALEEHWATGQKELRIIDTIEPLLTGHRLVIHPDIIAKDLASTERYATEVKKTYSGLFQLSMITRDKDCLVHDDRLDALAGAIYQITSQVAFDNEREMEKRRELEVVKWLEKMKNPSLYREDVPLHEAMGSNVINAGFGKKTRAKAKGRKLKKAA